MGSRVGPLWRYPRNFALFMSYASQFDEVGSGFYRFLLGFTYLFWFPLVFARFLLSSAWFCGGTPGTLPCLWAALRNLTRFGLVQKGLISVRCCTGKWKTRKLARQYYFDGSDGASPDDLFVMIVMGHSTQLTEFRRHNKSFRAKWRVNKDI